MKVSTAILSLLLFPLLVFSQEEVPSRKAFEDSLLNHLTGQWRMLGRVMGDSVEYTSRAAWKLNHQFLQWHLKDVNQPPRYEAEIFIGYDSAKKQYVVHWLDIFGGKSSQTLGFGTSRGNRIELLFNYPEAVFWDILTYYPAQDLWTFEIKQKDRHGIWQEFAFYRLIRIE